MTWKEMAAFSDADGKEDMRSGARLSARLAVPTRPKVSVSPAAGTAQGKALFSLAAKARCAQIMALRNKEPSSSVGSEETP